MIPTLTQKTHLDLLVRCLEKVKKYYSPNGGEKMVMNPMGRIRKKVTNSTNPSPRIPSSRNRPGEVPLKPKPRLCQVEASSFIGKNIYTWHTIPWVYGIFYLHEWLIFDGFHVDKYIIHGFLWETANWKGRWQIWAQHSFQKCTLLIGFPNVMAPRSPRSTHGAASMSTWKPSKALLGFWCHHMVRILGWTEISLNRRSLKKTMNML